MRNYPTSLGALLSHNHAFVFWQESVLQAKLTKLAVQIGYFGTVAGVLCFVVLTLRLCIQVCMSAE